ncbi:MAG: glycosyltransferase family 2 protein [Anaerolineae bacterium]|nr:glycosyltransferase family 2 protein [Anaerolineae bacterium]
MTASVSLIIVSWNSAAIIGATLDSIRQLDYPRDQLRVVVVDNHSSDDSVRLIRQRYPEVEVRAELINHGFAGGNNVGMKSAPADYFALVNPDVVLHPDWLTENIAVLEADANIGVLGSKIFYGNRVMLQHTGGFLRPNLLSYHRGDGELDIGQYDQISDSDYATGAAFVTRRSVAERLGYLPEAYFMYYEETEFCFRARQQGFRVAYAPKAVCYHDEKHSLGRSASARYLLLYHRSRYLFALRNLQTREQRLAFIAEERDWLNFHIRSYRYRALLQRSKLANWREMVKYKWMLP